MSSKYDTYLMALNNKFCVKSYDALYNTLDYVYIFF